MISPGSILKAEYFSRVRERIIDDAFDDHLGAGSAHGLSRRTSRAHILSTSSVES